MMDIRVVVHINVIRVSNKSGNPYFIVISSTAQVLLSLNKSGCIIENMRPPFYILMKYYHFRKFWFIYFAVTYISDQDDFFLHEFLIDNRTVSTTMRIGKESRP